MHSDFSEIRVSKLSFSVGREEKIEVKGLYKTQVWGRDFELTLSRYGVKKKRSETGFA